MPYMPETAANRTAADIRLAPNPWASAISIMHFLNQCYDTNGGHGKNRDFMVLNPEMAFQSWAWPNWSHSSSHGWHNQTASRPAAAAYWHHSL